MTIDLEKVFKGQPMLPSISLSIDFCEDMLTQEIIEDNDLWNELDRRWDQEFWNHLTPANDLTLEEKTFRKFIYIEWDYGNAKKATARILMMMRKEI